MNTRLRSRASRAARAGLVLLLSWGRSSGQEQGPEHWLQIAEASEARTHEQPHDGPAWLQWGRALLELEAPAESLPVLERAESELLARPLLRAATRFALARAQAALGHRKEALDWLDRSLQLGFADLALLEHDPWLTALSSEPAYQRIHDELRLRGEPRVDPALGVALEAPVSPNPFRSHGKNVLAYDLHIQSFWPVELTVVGLEVVDAGTSKPLARYADEELVKLLECPGRHGDTDKTRLSGNTLLVANLWVPVEPELALPRRLLPRLVLKGQSPYGFAVQPIIEGGAVAVGEPAPSLSPPLRGEGWVPRSAGNWSYHRRGLRAASGQLAHPQRFAADWGRYEDVSLGRAGETVSNADFLTYGQEVLAVADGLVLEARSDLPDNPPGDPPLVLPARDVMGNHVVLDLGGGRYATYCHLAANSVRCPSGKRVKRGQVLALVGNSGDATGPHLHFQLSTSPDPFLGQGLAYTLDSYTVLGWERFEDLQAGIAAVCDRASTDVRHDEMPVDSVVVRFL